MRQHANDNCEVPFCRECLAGIKRGIGMASELLDSARRMRSNPNQVSGTEILKPPKSRELKPVPMPAPPVLSQPKIVALFDGLAVRPIGPSDDIVVSGEKLDKWLETRDRATRQSLLAEIAERVIGKDQVKESLDGGVCWACYESDYCIHAIRDELRDEQRKLLTELAEEGDE